MKKLFVLIILILLTIIPVCAYEISDYYSSDDLSDYYGTTKACTKDGSENDCRNGNEYKFYLKMYDMYYLYKNKYNVTLDLPLIMAALYYGNEQMPEMFASNLNEYDRSSLKNNDTVTNLDWEYDFKNDECYTYLNANDNSYDMQILAKNMVTKKITYKCSGSDSTDNSGNTSSNNDSSNDTEEQKSSSSGKSNTSIAENKIFYIGDSWFELLNKYGDAKSSKSYFYAKSSKNADWVLTNYSSAKSGAYNGKSLKDTIPKNTSAFVVNFGLNGTSMWETTQKLINNLVKDYPGKTVYFIQTPHVGEQYSYGSLTASKMNSNIDNYNSKMKSYCSGKSGVEYINPTENIVDEKGKGYLKKSYASGTFHLNASGDKQWYSDIIKKIKGNNGTTGSTDDSDSSSDSSSSGDEKKATDVEISNYDEQLKCDSGTLDKDSINATYELDLKKYDKFLPEYIKYKYHTPGTEIKTCSSSTAKRDGDYSSDLNFLTGNFSPIHYYNQGDYSEPYGSYGTIASHGCGPTSLAIVISSILKKDHDPVEITNYVCEHGGCTSVGTVWGNITSTAIDYGLDATQTTDRQAVIDALGTGKALVIVIMCAGHFTGGGHFIVLTGVTSSGKVTVADPASRDRSTEWDFNIVAEETCGAYWIIKEKSK